MEHLKEEFEQIYSLSIRRGEDSTTVWNWINETYSKQLHKPDVMVSCEHEWHYHQMQNLNRIVMCMKCGKTKVSN